MAANASIPIQNSVFIPNMAPVSVLPVVAHMMTGTIAGLSRKNGFNRHPRCYNKQRRRMSRQRAPTYYAYSAGLLRALT